MEPEAAGAAPYVYLRQPVYYRTTHPVGTIVVDKQQSFLYVVRPSLSALRYGIGVGSDCIDLGRALSDRAQGGVARVESGGRQAD